MPLGGTGAALADVTVATVANPTPVSFYAGRLAWSAFDPAHNGYVLMTHAGGITSPVAVRPRGVPFDVDLGPDEQGDTVAVYSRCGQEPSGRGIPQWRTGRGCDIFKFTFATGRETRIASANGARSSEFLPSIWDTRVAFARVYERRKGKAGQRAYLYARAVLGAGSSTRLKPGPRGTGIICRFPPGGLPGADCVDSVEVGPTALDLRGRRLAFSWSARAGRCEVTGTSRVARLGGRWAPRDRRDMQHPPPGPGNRGADDLRRTRLLRQVADGRRPGHRRIDPQLPDQFPAACRDLRSERRVILWSATDAGRTFYLLSGGSNGDCAPDPVLPGSAGPCPLNERTR